jgi:hypothetical protein
VSSHRSVSPRGYPVPQPYAALGVL